MTRTTKTGDRERRERDAARWAAVVARDAASDGQFVFSVATTVIFCRPSCPARRARRENVSFHDTAGAAVAAGFRPCKRCRPDESLGRSRNAQRIAAACRAIEAAETPPRLADLAAAARMSPYHFHRVFQAQTGLTPKAYATAVQAARVRTELMRPQSITASAYAAGFGSTGRFYARAPSMLGMQPARAKAGGAAVTLSRAVSASTLGRVLVAASQIGIAAVLLGDDDAALRDDLCARFPNARLVDGDAAFLTLVARVVAIVDGARGGAALPLDVQGTIFQHQVWAALQAIPAGKTATYSEIAERIGQPKAARAVARACAANPAAVLVPCHRVVRGDGSLSGYRWGSALKRALLEREGAALPAARASDASTSDTRASLRKKKNSHAASAANRRIGTKKC